MNGGAEMETNTCVNQLPLAYYYYEPSIVVIIISHGRLNYNAEEDCMHGEKNTNKMKVVRTRKNEEG